MFKHVKDTFLLVFPFVIILIILISFKTNKEIDTGPNQMREEYREQTWPPLEPGKQYFTIGVDPENIVDPNDL